MIHLKVINYIFFIILIFLILVKSKDDRKRIKQLLQFAEPIEKSRIIYFDRRPESTRPTNNNIDNIIYPKQLYNKNSSKNTTMKNTTKKNNKKNDFIYSSRKPPIEAKQTIVKSIMFPSDEKENNFLEEKKCLNKQKEDIIESYENMIVK